MRPRKAARRQKAIHRDGQELFAAGVKKRVPDSAFVGIIDRGLRKHDPAVTMPWARTKPPKWARDFRPESMLDVGCGLGAFTSSVLERLGQWGCLQKLEQITLVEKEAHLKVQGATALRQALVRRVSKSTQAYEGKAPTIQVFVKPLRLPKGRGNLKPLPPLGKQRFDLIVASHITYYFGDGSGREFVDELARKHLNPGGLIWLVVRKSESPIYEFRAKTLMDLDLNDPKPYDYAEYFEKTVLPKLPHLHCAAVADQWYLPSGRGLTEHQRMRLCHLLMWRSEPARNPADPLRKASEACIIQPGPIFSERHFILRKE